MRSRDSGCSGSLESPELPVIKYSQVLDDDSESSSSDDDVVLHDDEPDRKRVALRRFHLAGAASRVIPSKDISPHLHQSLSLNLPFPADRVPFLVQYLTPLTMAVYDILLVAPPGRPRIEAVLIPIVNQILLSLVEVTRPTSRSPKVVLVSSRRAMRKEIKAVVESLTQDLPITLCACSTDGEVRAWARENDKMDILIVDPEQLVCLTRQRMRPGARFVRSQADLFMNHLQYLVAFELEELVDSSVDFAEIISNFRKEKDFTLILQTHTTFASRKLRKNLRFDYAEKTANLLNLLKDDYGMIMIDSSMTIRNEVMKQDASLLSRLQALRRLLNEHRHKYLKKGNNEEFYTRTALVVVESEERARFALAFLLDQRGDGEGFRADELFHMEREATRRPGAAAEIFKRIKRGGVMGLVTTNIHAVRLANSVVDKVIFFDLIEDMSALSMNVSRVVSDRRNVFFVTDRDLEERREAVASLVQYLQDVDAEVPQFLRGTAPLPHAVKPLF